MLLLDLVHEKPHDSNANVDRHDGIDNDPGHDAVALMDLDDGLV